MSKKEKLIAKTSNGTIVVQNLKLANTFATRLVGLLAHDKFQSGEGLLITRCSQVHTFFMRFPIDVLFLNSENKVIAIESLKPWRVSKLHLKAKSVLEIPFGTAKNNQIKQGDLVEVTSC